MSKKDIEKRQHTTFEELGGTMPEDLPIQCLPCFPWFNSSFITHTSSFGEAVVVTTDEHGYTQI